MPWLDRNVSKCPSLVTSIHAKNFKLLQITIMLPTRYSHARIAALITMNSPNLGRMSRRSSNPDKQQQNGTLASILNQNSQLLLRKKPSEQKSEMVCRSLKWNGAPPVSIPIGDPGVSDTLAARMVKDRTMLKQP